MLRGVLIRGSARVWAIAAWPRGAPGTLIYLFTLLVTQLTLSTVDDHLGQRLLISESTNLFNMARVPVQVLIASAFWIDANMVVTCAALIALLVVLVPLERWVGTGRWLVFIVTGHVGATLLTLLVTTCLLRRGLLSPAVAHASDVGVSYVVLTALGLLVHRVPRLRYRLALAALAIAGLITALVADQEIADLGHLLSFVIGFGLLPLVPATARAPRRDAPVRRRVRRPSLSHRWVAAVDGKIYPGHLDGTAAAGSGPSPSITVANGQIKLAATEKS